MVCEAAFFLSRYGGPDLSFSHLDIGREIPAHRSVRAFSKVFSFYCLHWVRDQGAAMRNIHRLLGPGGEALVVFLAKNPLFDAYRRMAADPRWQRIMKVINT